MICVKKAKNNRNKQNPHYWKYCWFVVMLFYCHIFIWMTPFHLLLASFPPVSLLSGPTQTYTWAYYSCHGKILWVIHQKNCEYWDSFLPFELLPILRTLLPFPLQNNIFKWEKCKKVNKIKTNHIFFAQLCFHIPSIITFPNGFHYGKQM